MSAHFPLDPSVSPSAAPPRRSDWPFRLVGVALLLAVIAFTWYWANAQQKTSTVYALLSVASAAPPDPSDKQEARREEVYRQTQVGLLRTHAVLEQALRA